jgi:hypothetical protein
MDLVGALSCRPQKTLLELDGAFGPGTRAESFLSEWPYPVEVPEREVLDQLGRLVYLEVDTEARDRRNEE